MNSKDVTLGSLEGGGKKPILAKLDDSDVMKRRLVWRFADVDVSGSWPPAQAKGDAMQNLLKKMADYESMTIGEIFKAGSEHGKKYDIESLPSRTVKRLEELSRDDETQIARLRCGGAPRLYGFLREHVFHVVWWDPNHEVFPSPKRHT